MKKCFLIFSLLLSCIAAAGQTDTSRATELVGKLSEYYKALEYESIDVQQRECDFLIGAVSDSALRQFVAMDIYRHYMDSPLMGAENVAVHVFDRWFAPGTIKMDSDAQLLAAKIYAEFNRLSLIGRNAPGITMESIGGEQVSLYEDGDSAGRYRILYFYDTACAKCGVETVRLTYYMDSVDYPVEFYGIYVGDDRSKWESYIAGQLTLRDAVHLWDPTVGSDFQRKYGVTQTPRLFLIAPDGRIIGRGLDAKALETLLDDIFSERIIEYGGAEAEALYDGIFSSSSGMPSVGEVKGIADYIAHRTLAKGDTLMFRQMAGDYLYYLASHTGEGFREGMKYHIEKNIHGMNDVWKSSDDTLKVLGLADMMSDLLSKALPGQRIPGIKVPGELFTWRGGSMRNIRLDRLKGRTNIVIFHTEGCEVCAAEKEAAMKMFSYARDRDVPKEERREAKHINVLMVNVDEIMESDPSLASRLMDSFDLSSLPYIVMTDQDGVILRRYMSLLTPAF